MDWLRIGAFGLLILYHIGMVFVPWPFHVKTAQPFDAAKVPMVLTNAWRLTLLFVVSGYASRALFARSKSLSAFLRNRNLRLLLPLAFGVAVIVPPQSWVQLVTQAGYTHGFGYFWLHDFFRFGKVQGLALPTWNHLWFVGYLWLYTLALGLLLLLPHRERLQRAFDVAFGGWRAVILPIAWLLLTQVELFTRWGDTQDVIGDGIAHLAYFPAFLFGFGMAASFPVMRAIGHYWRPCAVVAALCIAFAMAVEIGWPGNALPPPPVSDLYQGLRYVETWAAIVALIGLAERYWNHDLPIRATLTEAIFPFYLVHQTIIVVTEYALRPLSLGPAVEFALLVVATVLGCLAFYHGGRRIGWLRPLIGLRAAKRVVEPRPATG